MTHPVPRPFRRGHKNQARVREKRVRGSRDGLRLRGVCAACGEEHASPDTRWRCPGCEEGDLCLRQVEMDDYVLVHPRCRTKVNVVGEGG